MAYLAYLLDPPLLRSSATKSGTNRETALWTSRRPFVGVMVRFTVQVDLWQGPSSEEEGAGEAGHPPARALGGRVTGRPREETTVTSVLRKMAEQQYVAKLTLITFISSQKLPLHDTICVISIFLLKIEFFDTGA